MLAKRTTCETWKLQNSKTFSGRLGDVGRTPFLWLKNFGPGCIGRPILIAIFSYFSNIALLKNYPKCSVLTTFWHLDGQLGSQESTKDGDEAVAKIFGPNGILPTSPSLSEKVLEFWNFHVSQVVLFAGTLC